MAESQKTNRVSAAADATKKPLISLGFWSLIWEFRGAYAKGILTLFLVDAANVGIPLMLKKAIDAISLSDRDSVTRNALIILALFLFQAGGRYLWRVYLMGASHRVAAVFRRKFFDHVLKIPMSSHRLIGSGDLLARATQDIEAIRMALGPGVLVIADCVILFLLILPAMWNLSPRLTLISLAMLPLVPLLTYLCGSRIDTLFDRMQGQTSAMTQFIRERFTHVRLLKAFSAEPFAAEELEKLSDGYRRTGKQLALVESFFSPGLVLFTNAGTLLILYFGGELVLEGALTVGAFIAFQRLIVQLAWPMEAIGWAVTLTREAKASLRRVNHILNIPRVDEQGVIPAPVPSAPLLEIRDLKVSLGMPGGSSKLDLQASGLTLRGGQWVGIVGPIASGKSTFLDVLLRVFDPPAGAVYLHGVDLTKYPLNDLRKRLRIVDQPVTLLGEDLSSNVSLSLPTAVDKSTLHALSDIASFDPNTRFGLDVDDTLISEKGADLSGGQKQRIALMRALSTGPELLLLDDPFSGVDLATESAIFSSLRKNYPNLSVLFVTHRFELMEQMDEIWVMEGGRFVAQGKHEALVQASALYRGLSQTELVGEGL